MLQTTTCTVNDWLHSIFHCISSITLFRGSKKFLKRSAVPTKNLDFRQDHTYSKQSVVDYETVEVIFEKLITHYTN